MLFQIFTGINLLVLFSIMSIFIFDILRQYAPLFRTFRMLGVSALSNFAIIVGEVISISSIALITSIGLFRICFGIAESFITGKMREIGIALPAFVIDWEEIFLISLSYILFLIILSILFSVREVLRKWE